MRKKIIITIILIITILQVIAPIKIYANNRSREIISEPARIERYKSEQIVSETTGLDTATGLLLEPTVAFFSVVIDAIMQFLSAFMMQEEAKPVMIPESQIDEIKNLGDVGATHTIDDSDPYKNAFQIVSVKYPNFSYSPEKIFAGELDLLDINFLQDSNQDDNWHKIRNIVSNWYKILRMVTIIGLLSVLIYTGIKIIISSNTKDKAKYKEFFMNWFIGVALVFSLHYIMAFILYLMEEITGLLQGLTGVIEVNAWGTVFQTNLIGLARFKLQQFQFSAKVTYLAMYTALVVYTFKFTFLYLKRVLKMAFLTILAPIVALTYPIDKMNDGKAKGFQMWLKEYIFNALLQPMHYILYYVLVSTSLTLAANNIIYAIAALMFMTEAERLLKRIFGFDKASMGTVGGMSEAFATGAIVSSLTSFVKDPLHPFGGGKGKSSGGSGRTGGGSGNSDGEDSQSINFIDDANDVESFLDININPEINGQQESVDSPTEEDVINVEDVEIEEGHEEDIHEEDIQDDIRYSEEEVDDEIPVEVIVTDELGNTESLEASVETGRLENTKEENEELLEEWDIPEGANVPEILSTFRNENDNISTNKLFFNDNDSRSLEEMLDQLDKKLKKKIDKNYASEKELEKLNKEIEELIGLLMYRAESNEIYFDINSINPEYQDQDNSNNEELMSQLMQLLIASYNPEIDEYGRNNYQGQAKEILEKLEKRMAQNQYLLRQGGIKGLMKQRKYKNMVSPNKELNINSKIYGQQSENSRDYKNESEHGNVKQQNNRRFEEKQETQKFETKNESQINEQSKETIEESREKENEETASDYLGLGEVGNIFKRTRREKNQTRPTGEEKGTYQQRKERSDESQEMGGQSNIEKPEGQRIIKQPNSSQTKPRPPKVVNGMLHAGKTIIKPVWDTEKDPDVNVTRIAGKIFKGTIGITTGIAAATIQAGISITDGKYKPTEGIATFGAGFAGGVGITNAIVGRGSTLQDTFYEGNNEKQLELYAKRWYNRDDIIDAYNREFPGEGKLMRERARRNYVTRGITDVKEQKKAIKFANQLKKEKGLDEEEADKLAVATLQYRKNLTMNSNYTILFDDAKRNEYLDLKADTYIGSASKDSVRKLHDDFIQNVRDFDRANQ